MGVATPLLTRAASAVVLGLPVLLAAYLGSPVFELMIAAAAAVLAWEWFQLCGDGLPRTLPHDPGFVGIHFESFRFHDPLDNDTNFVCRLPVQVSGK